MKQKLILKIAKRFACVFDERRENLLGLNATVWHCMARCRDNIRAVYKSEQDERASSSRIKRALVDLTMMQLLSLRL